MNDSPDKEWWLDEAAHAGHEHLDPDYVAGYEAKAGYDPSDDIKVLQRHGMDERSVVVDVGAGTGRFTVDVARRCGRVIAVDVSPAMVAALGERVRAAGLDNVLIVEAGFLSYQHDGDPVDFVFTRNALHQIPDFWKGIALERIASMLRPDGILRLRDLVFDFDPSAAEQRIAAWMAGAVDDPAKGWTATELAEHVRLEHSTYSWLFEPMLQRAGFQILDKAYVRDAYGEFTCRNGKPSPCA